jgi:hypothetical protein
MVAPFNEILCPMAESRKKQHRIRFRRFFRHPIVLTLVGILIGTFAGWIVFSLSGLTGKPRFLVGGSLTGLITGLGMVLYIRRAETFVLSEVTLSVPEFAEFKFAVNSEYRRVSWKLFIDTLTRVATQPLAHQDGSIREALRSLYGLFTSTRELLKNMEPSKPTTGITVEMLAVRMLNHELRPFLSKWHILLKGFESTQPAAVELEWPRNADCRTELEALRARLVDYTSAYGELAGIKDVHAFFQVGGKVRQE